MTDSGPLPAESRPATPFVGYGPALNDEATSQPASSGAVTAQTAAGRAALADTAGWAHYAAWCAQAGFSPVPADPAAVGAYLASLGATHAPSTIRRRLAAIGKLHRVNGLPWNPSHCAIQEALQGVMRTRGRPVQKTAAGSFGRVSAFGFSFEGRAILMGIACFCLLLLLSTLFWMLLKGALVLSALLYLIARLSGRGTRPSTPKIEAASSAAQAFGAVRAPMFRLVAAGTLVAVVYVGAGLAGLMLGLGVCLGVSLAAFFRTRRLPWPGR